MSSQSDLNRGPYRLHADWQQTLEGATCLRLIYAKLSQSQQALQFLPPPVAGILFDFFAHCHQALQQLGAVGLRLRVISDDMVPDDDSVTQLFEAIRTQCAGMPGGSASAPRERRQRAQHSSSESGSRYLAPTAFPAHRIPRPSDKSPA